MVSLAALSITMTSYFQRRGQCLTFAIWHTSLCSTCYFTVISVHALYNLILQCNCNRMEPLTRTMSQLWWLVLVCQLITVWRSWLHILYLAQRLDKHQLTAEWHIHHFSWEIIVSPCPPSVLPLQGGLLATDVAVRHQELFTGLILSGPSVEVDVGTFTVSSPCTTVQLVPYQPHS